MEINRMSTLRIASSVLVALAVFGQADVVTDVAPNRSLTIREGMGVDAP